jgi:type IV secretory pathway component VirB8
MGAQYSLRTVKVVWMSFTALYSHFKSSYYDKRSNDKNTNSVSIYWIEKKTGKSRIRFEPRSYFDVFQELSVLSRYQKLNS